MENQNNSKKKRIKWSSALGQKPNPTSKVWRIFRLEAVLRLHLPLVVISLMGYMAIIQNKYIHLDKNIHIEVNIKGRKSSYLSESFKS